MPLKQRSNTQHDNERAGDDSVDGGLDWIADRRERLNVATQQTRFDIVQNIIAHPSQLPTLKELEYFLEGVRKSTIRNHIDKLVDAGVIARVELPRDDRKRDLPHVFYGLTESGREDLAAIGLLETEDILQEATLRTQVPDDVEQYMTAPRPEWGPANKLDIEQYR